MRLSGNGDGDTDETVVCDALTPNSRTSTIGSHEAPYHWNRHYSENSGEQTTGRPRRSQDELLFWQTMREIAGMRSPALYMMQLRQSFVNTYVSSDVIATHGSFYRVFYLEAPQSRALKIARDGLCLQHLGSRFDDRNLVVEGRKRYIAALNLLGQELEALKSKSLVDDGVIAASFTLGNAEVYNGNSPGRGYLQHMDGLYGLFRMRGPENMESKFAHALLHNTRHPALMDAILRRKPNMFSEPAWLDAANLSPSLGVSLTNLAFQIPALLERVDQLQTGDKEALPLLSELATIEKEFHEWLAKFCTLTNNEEAHYQPCSVSQFPKFREHCGGLAHVFPEMIEFPSFISTTSHVYVWTCLLIVRKATLDVSQRYAHPAVWSGGLKTALEASVTEHAVSLCQSMAYLSRPEHLFYGTLACSAPLYFALEWFEEQNAVQRSAWVRRVRNFLERDNSRGGGSIFRRKLDPPVFLYSMLPNSIHEEPD